MGEADQPGTTYCFLFLIWIKQLCTFYLSRLGVQSFFKITEIVLLLKEFKEI